MVLKITTFRRLESNGSSLEEDVYVSSVLCSVHLDSHCPEVLGGDTASGTWRYPGQRQACSR